VSGTEGLEMGPCAGDGRSVEGGDAEGTGGEGRVGDWQGRMKSRSSPCVVVAMHMHTNSSERENEYINE
jgi:hypothetical protein